ncbi:hypothetical protein MTR62_18740 [Novosphingobium sp. 1949]|uniref:Flap endonuclease-1-like 5' DNA nuclease n=1 Tax=Novosphingobium organovorum TaxID=2930092 RepID=A0ABT0BIG3_9SPHN|nr:hypothetical protein [Novosphingobium organovorum]MCJ2184710.1 hypothetical protein [Novosphingobium organovorum]
MIEANWVIFVAALVIGIAVAYWIFAHGSKPERSRTHRPDVLDEGAAPAQRNQALIDAASPAAQYELPVPEAAAPRAAHIDPPAVAGVMAGIGEVIAVAAQGEADRARDIASAAAEAEEAAAQDGAGAAPTASEPAPEPVSEAAAPAAPAVAEQTDNLRQIKGLGPKMEKLLVALGITRFAQIAAWSEADLDDLDTKLGAFAGRPRRDKWVEQARLLSSGETGAYEAEFGKL